MKKSTENAPAVMSVNTDGVAPRVSFKRPEDVRNSAIAVNALKNLSNTSKQLVMGELIDDHVATFTRFDNDHIKALGGAEYENIPHNVASGAVKHSKEYLKLAKKKLLPPIFDGFISGGMLKQLFGDANMRAEAKVPRVGDHHDKRIIQKYESTLLPGGQIAATVGPLKRPAPHRPLTSHGHEHGHGQGYGYGFGQKHKHEQSHVFDSMCEGEIGGRAGLKSGRPSTSAEVAHTMRPLFNAMSTYHSHLVDKPSNAVPLGVSAPRHNHTGKPTTNNLIKTLSVRGDLSSARRLSDPKQVSSAPAMGAFASTTSINTTPATTTTTTTTSNSNNDSSKVAANSGPHKVGSTTGKSVRGRSPLDVGGAGAGRAMSSTSPWLSSFLTKKEEDASAKGLEGGTVSPRKIGGGGSDGTDDYDDLFDYYYLDKKEARALEQERLLEADESAVPRTQKVKEQVLETKEQVNNRKMRRLYGSLRQQSKAIRTYLLSQITADLGKTPVPLSLPLGGGEGSKKKREGSGSGLGSGDEEKRADGESDGDDDDNEEDLDDEAFIANMEHELNKQRLLAEAEEEIKVRSIKDSVNRLFEAIKNGANAAISDKDKDNSAQLLSEIRTFFALKLETQEHDHRRLQALEFTGEEIGQEAEQSMVGLYESVTGGKADLEKRLRPPVKDLAKIVQMVHLLEQQAGEESSMYLNKYKDEKSAKSEKVSAKQMIATLETKLRDVTNELEAIKLATGASMELSTGGATVGMNTQEQSLRRMAEELRARLLESEEKVQALEEEKLELIAAKELAQKESSNAPLLKQLEQEKKLNTKRQQQLQEMQKHFSEERGRLEALAHEDKQRSQEAENRAALAESQVKETQKKADAAVAAWESKVKQIESMNTIMSMEIKRHEEVNDAHRKDLEKDEAGRVRLELAATQMEVVKWKEQSDIFQRASTEAQEKLNAIASSISLASSGFMAAAKKDVDEKKKPAPAGGKAAAAGKKVVGAKAGAAGKAAAAATAPASAPTAAPMPATVSEISEFAEKEKTYIAQILVLQKEVLQLKNGVEEDKKKSDWLKKKLTEEEIKTVELTSSLLQLRADAVELTKAADASKMEVSVLMSQSTEIKLRLEELTTELNHKDGTLLAVQRECASKVITLEEYVSNLKSTIDDDEDKARAVERAETLQREHKDGQIALDKEREAVREVLERLRKAEERLLVVQVEKDCLEEQVSALVITQQEDVLTDKHRKPALTTAEDAAAEDATAADVLALQEEVAQLRETVRRLTEEVARLKSQLKSNSGALSPAEQTLMPAEDGRRSSQTQDVSEECAPVLNTQVHWWVNKVMKEAASQGFILSSDLTAEAANINASSLGVPSYRRLATALGIEKTVQATLQKKSSTSSWLQAAVRPQMGASVIPHASLLADEKSKSTMPRKLAAPTGRTHETGEAGTAGGDTGASVSSSRAVGEGDEDGEEDTKEDQNKSYVEGANEQDEVTMLALETERIREQLILEGIVRLQQQLGHFKGDADPALSKHRQANEAALLAVRVEAYEQAKADLLRRERQDLVDAFKGREQGTELAFGEAGFGDGVTGDPLGGRGSLGRLSTSSLLPAHAPLPKPVRSFHPVREDAQREMSREARDVKSIFNQRTIAYQAQPALDVNSPPAVVNMVDVHLTHKYDPHIAKQGSWEQEQTRAHKG